jgi:hypothetical protein
MITMHCYNIKARLITRLMTHDAFFRQVSRGLVLILDSKPSPFRLGATQKYPQPGYKCNYFKSLYRNFAYSNTMYLQSI